MSPPESAAPRRLPARVAVLRPGRGFFLQADFGMAPVPRALLPAAIEERRVAFVAGSVFPADPESPAARGTMRLSFSQIPRERIREAMARLRRRRPQRRRRMSPGTGARPRARRA